MENPASGSALQHMRIRITSFTYPESYCKLIPYSSAPQLRCYLQVLLDPTYDMWQDTFFTAMLSGRISSQKDDDGFIFIDRDPEQFR